MEEFVGTLYWADASKYYKQNNNPIEKWSKKLVSCGPSAAINCLAAMGLLPVARKTGEYEHQPEQDLFDAMNDEKNQPLLYRVRGDEDAKKYPANEIPQFYPPILKMLYNIDAEFVWTHDWSYITEELKRKRAVMLCLEKPGHFIAAVAYNTVKDLIIYRDPYYGRTGPDKGAIVELTKEEYLTNVKGFAIVFKGTHNG